jgi:thioredoxin
MRLVQSITSEQFTPEVVESDVPVVVDFYATWCPPCRALAPILDELAVELAGQVKFVKVNVDEEVMLANRYRINAVPTLLVLHAGRLVDQWAGLQSAPALRERLATIAGRAVEGTVPPK